MSGVKVSENVPGAAVCIELLPSKVRSIFYSPANNRTLKGNINKSALCLTYGGTFPRKRCREQQMSTEMR